VRRLVWLSGDEIRANDRQGSSNVLCAISKHLRHRVALELAQLWSFKHRIERAQQSAARYVPCQYQVVASCKDCGAARLNSEQFGPTQDTDLHDGPLYSLTQCISAELSIDVVN